METPETPPNIGSVNPTATNSPTLDSKAHKGSFTQARDSRNRRVPYLWVRNGMYYAQLWVEQNGRKTARRFPLKTDKLTQAKDGVEKLRQERRLEKLPPPGRKPLLADATAEYLASPIRAERRDSTRYKDRTALGMFLAFAGNIRIDRITQQIIRAYCERRLAEGVSARTVNLDLISLRGLLKRAVEDGHLRELPRFKALRCAPAPKRDLLTPAQLQSLIDAACENPVTGSQLADFLQLLAFSGMREQEALRLRWDDVDLAARCVHIGRDGQTKNHEERTLEFNAQLEALLLDMNRRRATHSPWLFPSAKRGADRQTRTLTLRRGFELARERAGLPHAGFHDLRHYFCSLCVMNGIDFMTIAAWLGHKDGGILVGKVYGHLFDAHRRQAADRLNFGIRPLPSLSAVAS